MLANVVESYLDSLEEREFDAPFMALLRALGFWDIHLLHGPFEFGKDFIAKGNTKEVWLSLPFKPKLAISTCLIGTTVVAKLICCAQIHWRIQLLT